MSDYVALKKHRHTHTHIYIDTTVFTWTRDVAIRSVEAFPTDFEFLSIVKDMVPRFRTRTGIHRSDILWEYYVDTGNFGINSHVEIKNMK